MSKPSLGRGLGSLLTPRGSSELTTDATPKVTPGVATLISGNRPPDTSATLPPTPTSPHTLEALVQWTRLRWMLVIADLLLCGMAATIMLRRTSPVRPEETALCVAAILLGAWLGCSAWTMGRQRPR